jgi:hypothetical protein
LLPQTDQLHHMDKVDDVGDDEADDETAKHEQDPKVGSSIRPASLVWDSSSLSQAGLMEEPTFGSCSCLAVSSSASSSPTSSTLSM